MTTFIKNQWEKHAPTIISSIILGLLAGAGIVYSFNTHITDKDIHNDINEKFLISSIPKMVIKLEDTSVIVKSNDTKLQLVAAQANRTESDVEKLKIDLQREMETGFENISNLIKTLHKE